MWWNSLINIESYELKFKPFLYRWNIESRLEIKSHYKIGSKILIGRLNLPNQTIDLIDVVPENREKCKNSTSHDCTVFKFNTFVQLSGDKYFSREFHQPQDIPFQITFDFDSNNLESFQSYNHRFKNHHKNNNLYLSNYISSIKLLKIENKFPYQNSFYLERKNKYESNQSIKIPYAWSIVNGILEKHYEKVDIKFENYDNLKNNYIKDWFSIKTNGQIYLDQNRIDLENGPQIEIPTKELKVRNQGDRKTYYLQGNIENYHNGSYIYQRSTKNFGIFFPDKKQGYLYNKFKLLIKNHGYSITLKNHFSFRRHSSRNHFNKLNTWIRHKPYTDRIFKNLKKYKFIEL